MPKIRLSTRDKIIIVAILIVTLLIPTGAYVLSLRFKTQSQAQEYKAPVTSPKTEATTSSRLKDALDRLNQSQGGTTSSEGGSSGTQTTTETGVDEESTTSDAQLVLGPTLGFSVVIQGRPLDSQSTKAFLGIASGQPTSRPTYLLSFMVNIPASGSFDGISLSGLDTGATYTAYLKGESQIATASAFVVKATPTNLGALNLTTGDVNEDNVIDSLDYNLVKGAIGTTPSSSNWNSLYDFNLDNIVNSWDLNLVLSNLGKIGASGAWYSYTPISTASAYTSGGPSGEIEKGTTDKKDGYWMWVPPLN
jgi:hypothetical protein